MISRLEHRFQRLVEAHPSRAAGLVAALAAIGAAAMEVLSDGPVIGGAVGAALGAFGVISALYRTRSRTRP